MRICMFVRAMPAHSKGGVQDHALLLSCGLAGRGHDVTVVTTRHPHETKEETIYHPYT